MNEKVETTWQAESIEQAAQVSAAASLVGWELRYDGRAAVAMGGRLQESHFSAPFPSKSLLNPSVCDAVHRLTNAIRTRQNEIDSADRNRRRNPDRIDETQRSVESAQELLRKALTDAYGLTPVKQE